MAAFVPTYVNRVRAGTLGQLTTQTYTEIAARQGLITYIDATDGLLRLAQADSLANVGGSATQGAVLGLVATKPSATGIASQTATILTDAVVDFGPAGDALDYGQPLYLSDTVAGGLDTEAPVAEDAVVVQVGYCIPAMRDGYQDKLFQIDLEAYARVGVLAVIEGND